MKLRSLIAAAAVLGLGVPVSAVDALEMAPRLSLEAAKKMVEGCEAKAREKGWKMNVMVVDNGAIPVAFHRMDGAYPGSAEIARLKAETSAKFPFPTRGIEELVYGKDKKGGVVPGIAHVPGMIAFPGGVPIMAGSMQIGGIGVSGGTGDEDEQCAQAGLDAAKELLK